MTPPLQIDVHDLKQELEAAEPPFLLDVREAWEVEICGLPGAVNLPMGQIPGRLGELPRDRPIVVICHHGMRSLQVTNFLRAHGFELAQNLAGGVDSWAQQIDFTMPRY